MEIISIVLNVVMCTDEECVSFKQVTPLLSNLPPWQCSETLKSMKLNPSKKILEQIKVNKIMTIDEAQLHLIKKFEFYFHVTFKENW